MSNSAVGVGRHLECLGDSFVERLALDGGNLELERACAAGTVTSGESAGAPGRTTVNLRQICELAEGMSVSKRYIDDSMVCESTHGSDGSC